MNIELLTKNDLVEFKNELLKDLKQLVQVGEPVDKQWLKSGEVRKMLKISAGTLQNMRINGDIPYTKIGGTLFYPYEEIKTILNENKR